MYFVVQVCACWKKVEPKHTGKNFCKRYFSVLEKAHQSWIPKASWWLSSLVAPTFHENSPYERQKRRWTRASRNKDVPDLSPTPEERRPEGRERRKSTLKTEQENCVTADCRITAKKRKRAKTTAQCFIEWQANRRLSRLWKSWGTQSKWRKHMNIWAN